MIHPRSKRLFWSALLLVSTAIAFFAWRSHVRHTPEYAFQIIDGVQCKGELDGSRPYMTDQGLKVLTYLLDLQKGPTKPQKLEFQPAQIRGPVCFFRFSQDDKVGYMEFRKGDVWRFHDIVFTRLHGHDVEVAVSYAIDHPFLAGLKSADWEQIGEAFLKGFLIGWTQSSG